MSIVVNTFIWFLFVLGVPSIFVVANIRLIKKIIGSYNNTANLLLIVLTSLLIFAITIYELYYYLLDERNCSSGDDVINLTWWSRLIGYILFFIIYYFSIKCFAGKLKFSKWFSLLGIPMLAFIHYQNTFSMTFSYGGCGQRVQIEYFFHSETIGYVNWNTTQCDTNYKFESLVGGIYGYKTEGSTMTFYRVNEKPVSVNLGFLFWQLQNSYQFDPDKEQERQTRLREAENTLRTCYLYKDKFKKIE